MYIEPYRDDHCLDSIYILLANGEPKGLVDLYLDRFRQDNLVKALYDFLSLFLLFAIRSTIATGSNLPISWRSCLEARVESIWMEAALPE